MRFLVIIALFVLSPSAASAQALSGNDLYAICNSTDLAQEAFCLGFVDGAFEGMIWGAALPALISSATSSAGKKPIAEVNDIANGILGFSIPPEVSKGQISDIVKQYMANHPKDRHVGARVQIWLALRDAYPCK